SVQVRHGDPALASDADDAPPVTVPHRFATIGTQGAVVAAGDDNVAHGRRLSSCEPAGGRAEVAERSALPLDGSVERVDVLVRLSHYGDRSPTGSVVYPLAGRGRDQVVEGAVADAPVTDVGVDGVELAGSQLEGRGPFPAVAEPVDGGELV